MVIKLYIKICWKNYFSDQFKKMIKRHTKVGYKTDSMRQSACQVVNLITVYSYSFLFNYKTVGKVSD